MFLESKCLSPLFKFCFSLCFLALPYSFHHVLFLLPSNSSANLALLYTLNFTDPCSQAFGSAMCVSQCHCQLCFLHGCPDQFCGHSLPVLCPFSKLCCLFSASILCIKCLGGKTNILKLLFKKTLLFLYYCVIY